MPKLKPTILDERQRVIRALISAKMEICKMDEETLATKSLMSKRTLQNKRKRPETFTMDEVWRIGDVLHFTAEDYASIASMKKST